MPNVVISTTPLHLYVHTTDQPELVTLDIPDHTQRQPQAWWDSLAAAVRDSVQGWLDTNPPPVL